MIYYFSYLSFFLWLMSLLPDWSNIVVAGSAALLPLLPPRQDVELDCCPSEADPLESYYEYASNLSPLCLFLSKKKRESCVCFLSLSPFFPFLPFCPFQDPFLLSWDCILFCQADSAQTGIRRARATSTSSSTASAATRSARSKRSAPSRPPSAGTRGLAQAAAGWRCGRPTP